MGWYSDMKRSIQLTAVIGAVIISILVTVMSMRMIRGAASSTDKAVAKVSEFYLKELADRRTQVIASLIDSKTDQMQRAMQVISKQDLESVDSLRAFIGRTELLYELDLFALVDQDDIVYSRYSTYMGGSRYDFVADDMADNRTAISTVYLYGGSKHICIAIPLSGISFQGKEMQVCFVEIDFKKLADDLAFGVENAETWFGLYQGNGENLISMDFGPFDADQNLLTATKDMLSENEWNALNDHFQNGIQGEAVLGHQFARDTLYYVPVRDTGWMMTVLISGNLIQDQIRGISDELLRQSTQYFVLIGLALVVYFLLLFLELHRQSSRLLMQEKKTSREYSERALKSESELGRYKGIAYKDPLTGVQSKHAYMEKTKLLDQAIADGDLSALAILVGDLNGLKHINDTIGHTAGDQYLKDGAMMLCRLFQHSPVYRTGGDEFIVILQNADYENRFPLLEQLNQMVEENISTEGVVISAGMAELTPEDDYVEDVFKRADHLMYVRKQQLKVLGARMRT